MVLLYIDPGAGSMVIQALLAGILAVPFFFRGTVSRLLHRLRGSDTSAPGGAVAERDGDS